MAPNPQGPTKMSIKIDNHGYQKLKYPIVLYIMKLQFSIYLFSEKAQKKNRRRHRLLNITGPVFVSYFMKPNNCLAGSFMKPNDSLIPKLFQIPRTKRFFCCPDFGFKYLELTGISNM
jgi:hypothetical protein